MRLPKEIVLQLSKGLTGKSKSSYVVAARVVGNMLEHDRHHRRTRGQKFRYFWTARINAAAREWRMPYAWFRHSLRRTNSALDRKSLSALAETEPITFKALIDESKRSLFSVPSKIRDLTYL